MQKEKIANVVQRISAAIMDLMIAFILSTVLSSLVFGPLFSNSNSYKENYEVYESGLLSTSLFIKDEHNSNRLTCVIDDLNENGELVFSVDNLSYYDDNIVNFYTNYSQEKVDEYQASKKDSNVYVLDENNNTYVVKEGVTTDDAYNFFAISYINAINYFLDENETVSEAFYFLNLMNNYSTILSFGIGLLICYIIIPLFMKKGETIGKKSFALNVESLKADKALTKLQIVLREVFYVLIVVVLSYFTYCIPALISLIFVIANKNHLALHDYVAQTCVIDTLKTSEQVEDVKKDNAIEVEVKEIEK